MTVAIVGAAMTQFGERDAWLRDLIAEAGAACLADAGIAPADAGASRADADVAPTDVDHLLVARSSGNYEGDGGLAQTVAGDLGIDPAHARCVDQTSAAGGAGIHAAHRSIAAGESDLTLLVGGEKLTHLGTTDATDRLSAITHPVEYKHGVTMPAFAGLTARRYLDRYGAPRAALAAVAVKNHRHGLDNPKAHFRREIDRATVLDSPIVADPLRLYDFCPISDGSAALLFASEERAQELGDEFVRVAGVAGATGKHVVHEREELTAMPAVSEAGRRACERAGISPDDVDVAELHDMFTILELLQLEALGFAEPGGAWQDVQAGRTTREGDLPINTSGGLKSKGHPIAASGVAQAVELYEQLTDGAGDRQVEADVGLACNVGGFGNCVVTTILERMR